MSAAPSPREGNVARPDPVAPPEVSPPQVPDRRPLFGVAGIRLAEWMVRCQLATAVAALALVTALLLGATGVWQPPDLAVVALAVLTGACLLAVLTLLFEMATDTWFRLNLFSIRHGERRLFFPLAAGALFLAGLAAVAAERPPGLLPVVLGLLLAVFAVATIVAVHLARETASYRRRREGYVTTWDACLADTPAGERDALRRVSAFVDRERGPGPRSAYSSNCGFALPGLYTAPFHHRERFDWIPAVEARFDDIRHEILAALTSDERLRPYPFVGNGRWRELAFYKGGQRIDEHCAECPVTTEAVERLIPGGTVREAIVSVLEPGGYIPPHLDHAVPMLTCHMGLVIPPDCGIRVGHEFRTWQEGRCLVLDTSYEHEAWNTSDRWRAVLLVDFWPPDLTEAERDFFSRAFERIMRPHLASQSV